MQSENDVKMAEFSKIIITVFLALMALPLHAALILEDGFESGTMDQWRDAGAGTEDGRPLLSNVENNLYLMDGLLVENNRKDSNYDPCVYI